jgi:arylsulfatase A-like enzyme
MMAIRLEQGPAQKAGTAERTDAFLAGGVATGLVVGWLELALMLVQRSFDPRISMDSLRTNLHFFWMVPLANVVLFSALGLLFSLLARARPDPVRRFAWPIFAGMGTLGLGLAIEVVHPAAALVLACGAMVRLGPWIGRKAQTSAGIRQPAITALGVSLAAMATLGPWYVTSAERRTIATLPEASPELPNVLWLVLDNVRSDSLSLQGYNRPTTPNLERLASKGIFFNQARSTAPWTLPSHASMFTGQWPHALSVVWARPLDGAEPTIAEFLASQGYATAGFVGNTYYGNVRYGLGRGFARYEDCYENRTISGFEVIRSAALGRRVIEALGYPIHVEEGGTSVRKSAEMLNRDVLSWVDDRPRDRPFFVFANYFDAHGPFIRPESPAPKFGLGALPHEEKVDVLKRFKRFGENKLRPEDGTGPEILEAATAVYRDSYESCIAYLDDQIGRLYEDLERRGLASNTLVIITSDHGEHFREHGFFGHGLSLYRRELHVPLLVIPPGAVPIPARRVVSEMVSLRDLAATTVDLLGLSESTPFPGRSLAPLWSGKKSIGATSPAFSEVALQVRVAPTPAVPASLAPLTSVTAQGKEYIRDGNGGELLFDLGTDPGESTNIAGRDEAEGHRKDLARVLEGALRDLDAPPPQIAREFKDMSTQSNAYILRTR